MKQITSQQQLKDLRIGSILIQSPLENRVENQSSITDPITRTRFQVAASTPIGWEDIEFELKTVELLSGSTSFSENLLESGAILAKREINILGSELISDCGWWLKE